jgi:tetratricopeptide (TPR) repeat protein
MEALLGAFRIEPKNAETAYAIGEELRLRSWTGDTAYEQFAQEAMVWFNRARGLNRWDPYALVRTGMCLDWLDRHAEAERFFNEALRLDPNHWHTRAMMGWHYFQVEKFSETCEWMESALKLDGYCTLARTYLDLAKKKLASEAERDAKVKAAFSK